jgi:pimeloyl-[acyl-carrier protein] methyl ester esterase
MKPLVLLHGWALNRRVFDDLIEQLGRDCIALDLPGHGMAEASDVWSPAALATHMLAQMPPTFDLLGWSLGAQVAVEIAAVAPERVSRLVLVGATPKFTQSVDWPHAVTTNTLDMLATQLCRHPTRTIADFLALQVRGSTAATNTLSRLQQSLRAGGAGADAALVAALEWLRTTDQRSRLSSIQQPSLVVAGQYDRIVHPEASKSLAQSLPNALYLEIPRCGHAPFLSHPEHLHALLQEFLQ